MWRVLRGIALVLPTLVCADETEQLRQQQDPSPPPPPCNPVIIAGKKIATVWSKEQNYCIVAEAVGIVPAQVPSLAVGDDPLTIDIDGMVRLEKTPNLGAWALLGSLYPKELRVSSYTSQ
eukprot:COSAG02_NODE_32855_length_509_cov_1.039024_2_plen_119_part_01